MNLLSTKHKGFTILELMIATAVFSVLLAVIMTAFLQVGRMYIKGVNLSLTQEDTRTIIDSISNDIRFSGGPPTLDKLTTNNYFCVGGHLYQFTLGQHVDQQNNQFGLVRLDVGATCDPHIDPGTNQVNMLSDGMQLNKLTISCNALTCTISINVVFYGSDPGVLTPNAADPNASCLGSPTGSQFCATTSYSTTVLQSYQ